MSLPKQTSFRQPPTNTGMMPIAARQASFGATKSHGSFHESSTVPRKTSMTGDAFVEGMADLGIQTFSDESLKRDSAGRRTSISSQGSPGAAARKLDPTFIPQARNLKQLMEILEDEFRDNSVSIEGNVSRLSKILESFPLHAQDYQVFCQFDPAGPTRNVVDDGKGRFELVIECFGTGQAGPIHDFHHAGLGELHASDTSFSILEGHSIFKVLHGQMHQTLFAAPTDQSEAPLKMLKETVIAQGEVAHLWNKSGLSQLKNESKNSPCVSLHLYCPPLSQYAVYDEKTSHSTVTKTVNHSKFSVPINHGRRGSLSGN